MVLLPASTSFTNIKNNKNQKRHLCMFTRWKLPLANRHICNFYTPLHKHFHEYTLLEQRDLEVLLTDCIFVQDK